MEFLKVVLHKDYNCTSEDCFDLCEECLEEPHCKNGCRSLARIKELPYISNYHSLSTSLDLINKLYDFLLKRFYWKI